MVKRTAAASWAQGALGLGFRVCHSATARPTHEVVVGRAVFVTWNPPTTTRSRTRTGFVFCFFPFAVLH